MSGRQTVETGFTLLEVAVCLSIAAIGACMALGVFVPAASFQTLRWTAENVMWTMRWCQQLAITNGEDSNFQFSRYSPGFTVYVGPEQVLHGRFPPGVDYHDGYLQLGAANIRYSPAGTSQVGGVVRMDCGSQETAIHLYIGSGLQVEDGLVP